MGRWWSTPCLLFHLAMSYVLVQGEWYTKQVQGSLMTGDATKMFAGPPDEVVFNGAAFQYRDQPLTAQVAQRVRLYVVDAGPTLPSAFHVIGAIFTAVYPDGDAAHAQTASRPGTSGPARASCSTSSSRGRPVPLRGPQHAQHGHGCHGHAARAVTSHPPGRLASQV